MVLLLVVTCIGNTLAGINNTLKTSKISEINLGNKELAVVLGSKARRGEKRVTELLAERIKDRTGLSLAGSSDNVRYCLVLGTVTSNEKIKTFAANREDIYKLGADGYCIEVNPSKTELYVIGQSESGVVAGVGRLMREMRYEQDKLMIPFLQISETPQMPNRGMYLWARRHYFDQPDRVDRYIEELALWGCNGITFWFEMAMFNSFQDTTGRQGESNDWYNNYFVKEKNTCHRSG